MTPGRMRLGCDLPYFADPGAVRAFAQAAEDIGYDHLGFSEHVAATRGTPLPPRMSHDDPWHECFTTLGFLAGVTSRIELVSSMLLLPLRPAVLAAKQAAEIDLLSGERLRLGVAVGWNTGEARALGVDPATRGARFEEQITLMRRLWTESDVEYFGRFHSVSGVGIRPLPRRPVPVWIGAGNFASGGVPTPRALSRIARLADGFKMFAPLGGHFDTAMRVLGELRAEITAAGRDPSEVGVEGRLITHVVPEDRWGEVTAAWAAAGVTHLGLGNRVAGGGVDEQIELVRRVYEAVAEHLNPVSRNQETV